MVVFYSVALASGAFWLSACPFSVWIGRLVLDRDIREYGDGNPGAFNVFRAGGRVSGCLAVMLDVGKAIPFVILAHSYFKLPEPAIFLVALCAIMGHAFSPLLGFRGGKSVSVTFGVLAVLPYPEVLATLAIFMLLGFFFLQNDSWTVMLGPAGSLSYLVVTGASHWVSLFMLCVFTVLGIKHLDELRTSPKIKVRVINWLQSRDRETKT